MSAISLADVKRDLRVTHNSDDALLQILLDASEDEARLFMNRDELPYDQIFCGLAASVYSAVFLLVRSKYDAATPDEIAKLRQCAETVLMPYRLKMGI